MNAIKRAWQDTQFDMGFVRHAVDAGCWSYLVDDFDELDYPSAKGTAKAKAFVARAENWTEFGWWLYSVYCFSFYAILISVHKYQCWRYDHDWHDECWGGPESGGMGATCARCGLSYSHTLY